MARREKKSWKDAAIEVLQAAGKAMHYADIAAEIQNTGLRSRVGATPAASVSFAIHESIKKEGPDSPFAKVGPGEFILKSLTDLRAGAPVAETAPAAEEAAEASGIIRAFGMFWRRDKVDWVIKPMLKGQQQEGADSVNFADQIGVYLLHDGREVVYVGRTTEKHLGTRLSEHTRDRLNGRWDRFSWFGLLGVTETGELAQDRSVGSTYEDIIVTLEALLIEGLEPRQNRRRGDAFRAVEYLQVPDPELVKKGKKKVLEEALAKLG